LETELESNTSGYGNSIEALHDLLKSYHVTEISTGLSYLANGIQYSYTELTCSDGVQCGLLAYGDEALELNRIALEQQSSLSPVVIS
jgi:hypothetical protein